MTKQPQLALHVDVVVVAYNSADTLRDCVEPLAGVPGVNVVVVDNASPDPSLEAVADLPVDAVRAARNGGFAAGCNLGIARGHAPAVLLLNPDARLDAAGLAAMTAVLAREPSAGLVAPRILEADGSLAYNLRRFPRRRSTFAQALFLHRLRPNAPWADELVRDPAAYAVAGPHEWVSGACMLIRRSALEQVGPLDERFFLYSEDIDLCARLHAGGWGVLYEPAVTARHEGGRSAPREELFAVAARNRVRYVAKHEGRLVAAVEALGVALGHATHAAAHVARPAVRRGHLRALRAALRPSTARPEEAR